MIAIVAAIARGGALGFEGRLPWDIPEDLKRFKALTWESFLVMGRKTWESIGRPLPGRTSLVVTSKTEPLYMGANPPIQVPTLDAALERANGSLAAHLPNHRIFVIALPRSSKTTLLSRSSVDTPARVIITHRMYSVVRLEVIAPSTRSDLRMILRGVDLRLLPGLQSILGHDVGQPWVARIVGPHPRYKLLREFVRGQRDFIDAYGTGRGIKMNFYIKPGVYEVREPLNRTKERRYFIRASDGRWTEIPREEALREVGLDPDTITEKR